MFAKYFILLCVVGVSKSVSPSDDATKKDIEQNKKYGCSSSADYSQLSEVDQCFKAANPDYYEKTVVAITTGGGCADYITADNKDTKNLIPFCQSLVSSTDSNSQQLAACVINNYGRPLDGKILAQECTNFGDSYSS